jgi:hypothetical protein
VLLHELAHVARLDDWTNLLARLCTAALGLHPVAAWVISRVDRERESACDDWVVSMTGEARPYAASLTRVFELTTSGRHLLASGMAAQGSRLGERIEKLLQRGREFKPGLSMETIGIGAIVLVGLVFAAGQSPIWVAFAQEPILPPTPPMAPFPANAPLPPRPAAIPAPLAPATPPAPAAPPRLNEFVELQRTVQMVEQRALLAQNNAEREVIRQQVEQAREQVRAAQERAREVEREFAQERGQRRNFLAELSAAGYKDLSVDEIVELARHGVSIEYMKQMADVGWPNLTREQYVELARYGVSPEYLRAMKDAGFGNLKLEQVLEAARHGVDAEDIKAAKDYNKNLTLDDIITLKRHGVL